MTPELTATPACPPARPPARLPACPPACFRGAESLGAFPTPHSPGCPVSVLWCPLVVGASAQLNPTGCVNVFLSSHCTSPSPGPCREPQRAEEMKQIKKELTEPERMSSSLAQREDRPRALDTGVFGAVLAFGYTLAIAVPNDSQFHAPHGGCIDSRLCRG